MTVDGKFIPPQERQPLKNPIKGMPFARACLETVLYVGQITVVALMATVEATTDDNFTVVLHNPLALSNASVELGRKLCFRDQCLLEADKADERYNWLFGHQDATCIPSLVLSSRRTAFQDLVQHLKGSALWTDHVKPQQNGDDEVGDNQKMEDDDDDEEEDENAGSEDEIDKAASAASATAVPMHKATREGLLEAQQALARYAVRFPAFTWHAQHLPQLLTLLVKMCMFLKNLHSNHPRTVQNSPRNKKKKLLSSKSKLNSSMPSCSNSKSFGPSGKRNRVRWLKHKQSCVELSNLWNKSIPTRMILSS